jgi:hypothetical protein
VVAVQQGGGCGEQQRRGEHIAWGGQWPQHASISKRWPPQHGGGCSAGRPPFRGGYERCAAACRLMPVMQGLMSTVVTEDAIREPLQLLELSDHEVNMNLHDRTQLRVNSGRRSQCSRCNRQERGRYTIAR